MLHAGGATPALPLLPARLSCPVTPHPALWIQGLYPPEPSMGGNTTNLLRIGAKPPIFFLLCA